jgi:predicted kinase
MKKLIMTIGLPGSGKSFWAARQDAVVVNKDDIRAVLSATTGWVWSQKNEADVIAKRDEIIIAALKEGHNVISSDTNFAHKHKVRLEQIARENGAEFEVVKFTDVPIETCIERDKLRDSPVGEKIIRTMASRYIASNAPDIVPYTIPDGDVMSAIICDLDGTLALLNGRSPYDASTCEQDKCNNEIKVILEVFYRFMQWQIIYLSGREDKYRPQTERFLRDHHCPPGPLHMRTSGDFRKDCIIKSELFDAHIRDKYRVRFALDDRNQVVELWRGMGLTCLQVADGNF